MSNFHQDLSIQQIESIGRKLASDRLPLVNALQPEVHPSDNLYSRYGKRAFDIFISAFACAVTLPVNFLIGAVTLVDVGRPLFFKQTRVGRNGRRFVIVKFRNMRDDRDANGDLLPPEERVTRWGKFVRRTSLDELLNFWCVLKGDMSLIGPRPLPEIYLERYSNRHLHRLDVKPGLECPPRDLSKGVWTWNDQLENDIWYVENVSFKTDCMMLRKLIKFALDRKSAQARAVASRGSFMGYDFNGAAINDAQIPEEYVSWAKLNK
ncbi:MAG: sugar transferase [Eggerthellaceae bacterium]|jgi:lipopolysaccharide/colanic/teichoic acid biosynthesis glycosyltransferase|nr:sugar transferase [Eggerthellaceae bacterium]